MKRIINRSAIYWAACVTVILLSALVARAQSGDAYYYIGTDWSDVSNRENWRSSEGAGVMFPGPMDAAFFDGVDNLSLYSLYNMRTAELIIDGGSSKWLYLDGRTWTVTPAPYEGSPYIHGALRVNSGLFTVYDGTISSAQTQVKAGAALQYNNCTVGLGDLAAVGGNWMDPLPPPKVTVIGGAVTANRVTLGAYDPTDSSELYGQFSVRDAALSVSGDIDVFTRQGSAVYSNDWFECSGLSLSNATVNAAQINLHDSATMSLHGATVDAPITFGSNVTVIVDKKLSTINTPVAAGNMLAGPTWQLRRGAKLNLAADGAIHTLAGRVQMEGVGAELLNLASLAEITGSLSLESGATFTTAGNLANKGALSIVDYYSIGTSLRVQGDLASTGSISLWSQNAKLDVAGTLVVSGGTIDMQGGTVAATTMRLHKDPANPSKDSVLAGNGTIEGNLLNTDGRVEVRRALSITGDFTQQPGGTLKFFNFSPFNQLTVNGSVNLEGTLQLDFWHTEVPGNEATLMTFRETGSQIRFSQIQPLKMASPGVAVPVRQEGSFGIRVVPLSEASLHVPTNIAAAETLELALPNFTSAASTETGSVSLKRDSQQDVQAIYLADLQAQGDTAIVLKSPAMTLPDVLAMSFSYRFETLGKLQVLFHDAASGVDTLLQKIDAPAGNYDVGRYYYATFSAAWILDASSPYNLAGHNGEIWVKLSNVGDPALYLSSLEITGANVPEPAGAMLLLLTGALGLRRRRAA